jgi:hypothetical protein
VTFRVLVGDLIRDALVAQSRHQPIEDSRSIPIHDRCSNTVSLEIGTNLVDQAHGTGKTADSIDQPNGTIDCGWSITNFGMVSALGRTMLNCRRGGHSDQIIETSLR